MGEKKLPIKVVMQRESDTQKNIGGGSPKFFCEVNSELEEFMVEKFGDMLDFYSDVFEENKLVPVVGKIKMKSKKGLILTLFCTLMSLSSCNNNCVEEVCPSDDDVVVVTPREYEDSNKQDPLYNGEDVYVSSIKTNQYGSTYNQ